MAAEDFTLITNDLNEIDRDRQLFKAGYDYVDSMVPRADAGGAYPLWHGWALREAFWLGALWEKRRATSHPESSETSAPA